VVYSMIKKQIAKRRKNKIDSENLLGTEYTGLKGQESVNKLLEEKQGHVKSAFSHNDIGDVALIWRDDNIGLQQRLYTKNSI